MIQVMWIVVRELYLSHTYGTCTPYARMVTTDDRSGTDVIVYPMTAMEHQRCCKEIVEDRSVLCQTDHHLSTPSFSVQMTSFAGVVEKPHIVSRFRPQNRILSPLVDIS